MLILSSQYFPNSTSKTKNVRQRHYLISLLLSERVREYLSSGEGFHQTEDDEIPTSALLIALLLSPKSRS